MLAVALAYILRGEITQRALANARQSAVLLERGIVEPQLSATVLRTGLSKSRVRAIDRSLAASLASKQIARIKVWAESGRVVYATDHAVINHRFAVDDDLRKALSGGTVSDVSNLTKAENITDRAFGQLLEVYTPLRFGKSGRPAGAFELYLPYRPIAAAIKHDTTQLSLVLLAGLVVLYLALFRIVASASRRLRRQAAENEHLALHDPLTNLPNRSLFHDRAAQAIRAAKRNRGCVALMLFDLDRFKEVNDTLGHHNGDLLLKQIGSQLAVALRESDTIARLGGDEFGVLLPTVADNDAALSIAESLRQTLRDPVSIDGILLDLEVSVGIAVYPSHGDDVEALLQHADVAMYVAKADSSGCELYSADRDTYSPERLALVGELRRALDQHELVLHYMPKADLRSGSVGSVEALIRWQHPDRGLLQPDEFIPLAEHTGMIREVTQYALNAALRQLRAWREEGLEISVAVNLSARDLLDLELPDTIHHLLTQYDIPGNQLELEITETVILANPMRARLILNRLSAMGIQLAVDDFGTGYSSLAYLKRLPVGELKIDRSFVMNMGRDENDAVIVRSTIDLARNLGLRVVAEGVENETIWNALADLKCDQAQGYYLSCALPEQDLAQWLRQHQATTPSKDHMPTAAAETTLKATA